MILLKTNPELKKIYTNLIKTMDAPVTWNDIFVVVNNNLILAGNPRSLIFNFENKRAHSDILDLPIENQDIRQMPSDPLINNIFNMTLYAFGKWGAVNKIKVEKEYTELNALFQTILKEIQVEPSFQNDNFRFYKEGVQITYEDTIDAALNTAEETVMEMAEEDELGLWHNVKWKKKNFLFQKKIEATKDVVKPRIGHNFYSVNYVCPSCKEKIFMSLFPEEEEVLIETEEGRVYLARAYACNQCNIFYTPKPEKLLGEEEEVYCLAFDDDRVAYEDYLERLGKQGTRDTSSRLNEYESERNKKEKREDSSVDEEVNEDLESENAEQNKSEDKTAEEVTLGTLEANDINEKKAYEKKEKSKNQNKFDFSIKTIDELKSAIIQIEKNHSNDSKVKSGGRSIGGSYRPENLEEIRSQLKKKLKTKYEARLKIKDRMSKRELIALKKQIQKEEELSKEEIQSYTEQINESIYENEEKEIRRKMETASNKSDAEIDRIIDEIKQGEGLEEVRKKAVEKLKHIKNERDKRKVERQNTEQQKANQDNLKKKEEEQKKEHITQNKSSNLKHKRHEVQKKVVKIEEIEHLVMHKGNRSRKELMDLYKQLEGQGYQSKNVKPYLDEVHEEIVIRDKEELAKICPDISNVSFEEGIKAYKKISEGVFLPELKERTLERIRRRLLKIKTDENLQLVRKMQKEMQNKFENSSRIHFYEARKYQEQKELEQDENVKETLIMFKALNKYAVSRDEFEFPLFICDSSRKENGKKGFILTPEHIFYRSFLDSGRIHIMDIEEIEYEEKKFKKNLYIKLNTGERKELPNLLKKEEKINIVDVINGFITYLQEKPESRSIEYLVKEEHEIKCCYRCGYTYKGGNICPKCGSKINR